MFFTRRMHRVLWEETGTPSGEGDTRVNFPRVDVDDRPAV